MPEGWSRVVIEGRPYGVVRTSHAGGRTLSVSAEQLGGTDTVSANVLRTRAGDILKPCEMSAEKVMAFLRANAAVRKSASADGVSEPRDVASGATDRSDDPDGGQRRSLR